MGVGVEPVVFTGHADWDAPVMIEYEGEMEYIDGPGLFPVYLLRKGITAEEVIELFASSAEDPEADIEGHPVWTRVLGGPSQNAMGQYDFVVIKMEDKEWGDFTLNNLRVIAPDGEEVDVDDRAV